MSDKEKNEVTKVTSSVVTPSGNEEVKPISYHLVKGVPIPIYNSNNDYIKAIREKVGHDGLYLPGSGLVIYRRNNSGELEFLLQLRTDLVKLGLFGGGMNPPLESPIQSAVRELEEEAGIVIDPKILKELKTYAGEEHITLHNNGDLVFHIVVTFATTLEDQVVNLKLKNSETREMNWYSVTQLKEMLKNPEEHFFMNNVPIIRDMVDNVFNLK